MAASRSGSLNSIPGAVEAVVAGHISLDLSPALDGPVTLEPGQLVVVGPALLSTGGVVCNTGLALHRLGVRVRLTGKVGADLFGRAVLDALLTHDERLAGDIVVAADEDTSYTIVINPPGLDRSFLHCAGVNRTFCADDVRPELLAGSRVFHFGYPPLMPAMYANGGAQLARMFARVHETGPATSLDLCAFDPDSAAGKVDWPGVLTAALPHVDLFAPSIDEVLFILDRPAHDQLRAGVSLATLVDRARLAELADMLIGMGAASWRSSSDNRGCTSAPRATPAARWHSVTALASPSRRGAPARSSRRVLRPARSSQRRVPVIARSPVCSPRCCAA